jgi:hypothetical protein
MRVRKSVELLINFVEGFAVTWSPLTMVAAIGVGYLLKAAVKCRVTPLKNAIFLLGALTGWFASYSTGGTPFFRWGGLWWIPTGLVVAAAIGIPVGLYFDKKKPLWRSLGIEQNERTGRS